MSFNIRNIRELSTDQTSKFLSHLAKRISDFSNAQQQEDLENKEDIYSSGQDVDTRLGFHNMTRTKYFNLDKEYFPTFEPDLDKLRVWVRGYNVGRDTRDWSEYGRTILIHGEPLLIDGTPFDDGTNDGGTLSTALRFNSNNDPEDYITITHQTLIRASEGLSDGISFFMRFRVQSLATQGGFKRTLFEKTDNNPITDGVVVAIDNVGRLRICVENSDVQHAYETATGTIAINTVYDLWITYNKSGNVVKCYVNGVEKSLSATSSEPFHSDNLSDFDYHLMRRGDNNGYVEGDLYDFRVYREKIISSTEQANMYVNKWTILDVPFGQVMVTDYYAASPTDVGFGSFTSASFTSTSFTV